MQMSCAAMLLAAIAGLPLGAAGRPAIENAAVRVEIDPATAAVDILDRKTGERWDLGAPSIVFTDQNVVPVKPSGKVRQSAGELSYAADPQLEFRIRLNGAAVEYSFSGPFVSFVGSEVQEIQIIRKALLTGTGEGNYYAVPNRMGVLAAAAGDKPYSYRLPAYQTWGPGYSMAMFGAVRNGSALLATWEAPHAELMIEYGVSPRQLAAGIALREGAHSVRLEPLGRGGYVEIAKAYRPIAQARGLWKSMAERLRENPSIEKLIGAADIKPFTLVRNARNGKLDLGYTFDEAAAVAEHMSRDLGMDRAMLILAGWIRRGYDNQHPDILPAAPELGGNEALARTSQRAKALGWLFGLHDNYQDLYQDAPSWDANAIIRTADGAMMKGGAWAGGQCYIVCSKKGLEFAMRPQNLPRVRELFAPTAYFIDCTTANRLKVCHHPEHRTTKTEDIGYRLDLLDFARKQFGIFGSEEGFEWAVAHTEYFEGLLSHKTGMNQPGVPGVAIPMFEIVYGDSIPIYAHQGDRARPDMASYILDHILYAEMPVYDFGRHRYWENPAEDFKPPQDAGDKLIFSRGGRHSLTDQFIRNTYAVLSPLNRLTATLPMSDHRFVTPDRAIESTRFGDDVEITVNYGAADYRIGDAVLPRFGFLIKSPTLVAFCAREYGGVRYSEPTLFVLWSQDAKPLAGSARVRVYRGFGGKQVAWRGGTVEVEAERTLTR